MLRFGYWWNVPRKIDDNQASSPMNETTWSTYCDIFWFVRHYRCCWASCLVNQRRKWPTANQMSTAVTKSVAPSFTLQIETLKLWLLEKCWLKDWLQPTRLYLQTRCHHQHIATFFGSYKLLVFACCWESCCVNQRRKWPEANQIRAAETNPVSGNWFCWWE